MRLHEITTTHAKARSQRIGRGNGSGRGTFAGRGVKGQKARSGGKKSIPRTFIGGSTSLIQRLPKLKGFKSHAEKPVAVNVARLAQVFKDGDTITIKSLLENKVISAAEAIKGVRITGASGEVAHKFKYDTESEKLSVTKKLLS